MTSWRLLDSGSLDGPTNMAVDVALTERARRTGETVFRTYSWLHPTLSLGRNQAARGRYDHAALEERRVAVVRRPTGGRAILHWRELTYSVTTRADSLAAARRMYRSINEIILDSLRRLGVEVEIAPRLRREHRPDDHPCFAQPSAGEIVARTTGGPGKIVGSAQYVENGALLQHGSILLHDDQHLLQELTGGQVADTCAASVSEVLGRDASPSSVTEALFDAVRRQADAQPAVLDTEEIQEAAERHVPLFRDPLWTWRR